MIGAGSRAASELLMILFGSLPFALWIITDVRAQSASSVPVSAEVAPVRSFNSGPRLGERAVGAALPSEESTRLNALGVKLLISGSRSEGAERIREAISVDEHNAAALYNLAGLLLSEGNAQEAVRSMEQAVHEDPDNLQYLNRLAEAHIADMDLDAAILTYNKVVQIDPHYEQAMVRLGTLYGLQKRYDDAERTLRLALEAAPNDPKVLSNLGSILIVKEQYAEAGKLLEQADAIEQTPENSVSLGVAAESLGELAKARALYEEAIKRGSTDEKLQSHLAAITRKLQDADAPAGAPVPVDSYASDSVGDPTHPTMSARRAAPDGEKRAASESQDAGASR